MSSELRVDTIKLANGNSATASGLGIGGVGKIGQLLQGQNSTQIATSLSLTDFDIVTQSITPTATSSTIFLSGVLMGIQGNSGSVNTRLNVSLYRGSTQIMTSGANRWNFSTSYTRDGGFAINWKDSPSSTSALSYRLVVNWADTGGSTVYINKDGNSGFSTLTLMEVLA